ncbi:MAG: DegT/DnrJ/EryC1/StrS family aminotransferase, partial [Bdellovibrionales bacterium]|nr:DegT/DnrJ/EryC1/StrS family aminotransferase [Bdellovibrionales bacterium]
MMYPRKRLDISWSDLLFGVLFCCRAKPRSYLNRQIESLFSAPAADRLDSEATACLSIRSGFDLYLKVLNLKAGSEVLVSALTIPDMWRLLEHHGLIPVPIDVDPLTLAPKAESLERARSAKTRAVLVAHLFGTRIDLGAVAEFTKKHSLFLWEDCAQAFSGLGYTGDPRADISMFSFGPIKTATALAGGVLVIRDSDLRKNWRQGHARYPAQTERSFSARVFKYALIKG